jgi:hypothetical protein
MFLGILPPPVQEPVFLSGTYYDILQRHLVIFNIRKMTVNILDAKYFFPPNCHFHLYFSMYFFFLNIRMIINLLQNNSVADDVVEECRNMFRKEIQVLGQEVVTYIENDQIFQLFTRQLNLYPVIHQVQYIFSK